MRLHFHGPQLFGTTCALCCSRAQRPILVHTIVLASTCCFCRLYLHHAHTGSWPRHSCGFGRPRNRAERIRSREALLRFQATAERLEARLRLEPARRAWWSAREVPLPAVAAALLERCAAAGQGASAAVWPAAASAPLAGMLAAAQLAVSPAAAVVPATVSTQATAQVTAWPERVIPEEMAPSRQGFVGVRAAALRGASPASHEGSPAPGFQAGW